MTKKPTPPPGFERFDDLPMRFAKAQDRLIELDAVVPLRTLIGPELPRRLLAIRLELNDTGHCRNARTVRKALLRFDRELADVEKEIARLDRTVRQESGFPAESRSGVVALPKRDRHGRRPDGFSALPEPGINHAIASPVLGLQISIGSCQV